MGEEEWKRRRVERDGSYFGREGTARGSGLAGIIPSPFFTVLTYIYSQQGRAKVGAWLAGSLWTHSVLLLLWAGRDRLTETAREREGCRQPHMAGRTKEGASKSSLRPGSGGIRL